MPAVELQAYLDRRAAPVLTDAFAPVDNLISVVFRKRGEATARAITPAVTRLLPVAPQIHPARSVAAPALISGLANRDGGGRREKEVARDIPGQATAEGSNPAGTVTSEPSASSRTGSKTK